MLKSKEVTFVLISTCLIFLVSCGGGGGGDSSNSPPVADAGPDQVVSGSSTIWLDGTGSWDPDGDPISYSWEMVCKPDGVSGFLSAPTTHAPNFNAAQDGSYVISLVVNDGQVDSAPDTVTVTTPVIDSGDLVGGFGTGGIAVSNPSAGYDILTTGYSDGTYLYLAGYDNVPGNYQWHVEKRTLCTGSLVAAFGSGGVVTSNPSSDGDTANAIASDGGWLYVAGDDYSPGNGQWRIEKRSIDTGALEATFGSGGVITSNPGTGNESLRDAVSDGSYLYLIGYDSDPGDFQWRIEKRSLITGELDSAFGTSGVVTVNPSPDSDGARAGVIAGSYLFIAGLDSSPGNFQWRIEKRSLANGNLDSTFGSGGIVIHNPSDGSDGPVDVESDGTHLYVTGYDSIPGNSQWRVEKRSLSSGNLDSNFGTGGVIHSDPTIWDESPHTSLIDGSHLYLVGYDIGPGSNQWRFERRDLGSGALDTTFADSGVLTLYKATGWEEAWGAVVDDAYLYVFGFDQFSQVNGDRRTRIEKRLK